jgi:hypothetical protein
VWVHDAGEGAAFAIPVGRKILARYFGVSDLRNPYGCDTPQTTPGPCAYYTSHPGWAEVGSQVYTDPIQRESIAEDFHDPSFPWPKDAPQPSASAALPPRPTAPAARA